MTDKLVLKMIGSRAQLTLNNPPANTWDAENLTALVDIITALNNNKDCFSLVITGQGEKFFSAGADLKLFADGQKATARKLADCFGAAFEALAGFRGVSIAAINGFAMGGGLECAMACDIRIVEEHALLALPEASVGLLPSGLGTQHLSWIVGEGWAKRMILCGERIDAATAEKIGLAEEVVPRGTGLAVALALAKKVAQQSPASVAASKRLIMSARHGAISDAYGAERDAFVNLFGTHDQQEGVQAFLEKRKAEWENA